MNGNHSHPAVRGAATASMVLLATGTLALGSPSAPPRPLGPTTHHQVIVPEEDRFKPFSLTIHAGDSVEWINTDTDDHTVVSNDFFNTTGDKNVDMVIPGTDGNGGIPGKFKLKFTKPGVFNYYCRFHSMLDDEHQPTAPGPDGGIQDPTSGNFGTPMMGVITVLPGDNHHGD